MLLEILQRNIPEIISSLIGGYCFFKLDRPYNIVWFIILLGLLTQITGQIMSDNFRLNNHWVYNCYILPSGFLWATVAYLFNGKQLKMGYIAALSGIVLSWLCQILSNGFGHFANYAWVIQSVILVLCFLYVLYKTSINSTSSFLLNPALWACLAVIIFYGCNLPYISLLNYFNHTDTTKSYILYDSIVKASKAVHYLLLSVGFVIAYTQQKSRK